MKKTGVRRNYFVEKDFQGRLVFLFFSIVVIGAIIFTLIFTYLSSDIITVTYKENNLRVSSFPRALFYEMLQAHWLFIFIVGIAVCVIAVFISHRIGGPIYRFKKTMNEIATGNLTCDIRLRKLDEGKDLADCINKMIDSLNSRIGYICSEFDAIERDILLLKDPGQEDMSGQSADRLKALKNRVESLRQNLTFFRLKQNKGL
jgi:methyl-accepting chemotaxis protein